MSLATQGYFDGTICHRLTTLEESGIAVIQCGDPSGTGSGGPGYTFADETTGDEKYTAGVIAMANRGPDTNGSQFFIVYDDSPLPPDYTVFGSIDDASLKPDPGPGRPGHLPRPRRHDRPRREGDPQLHHLGVSGPRLASSDAISLLSTVENNQTASLDGRPPRPYSGKVTPLNRSDSVQRALASSGSSARWLRPTPVGQPFISRSRCGPT